MVPGGLVVAWQERYFDSGRPCDVGNGRPCSLCRTSLITAAQDFKRVWGPRLEAEVVLRNCERLLTKELTLMERAETEALRFRTRELVRSLEQSWVAA